MLLCANIVHISYGEIVEKDYVLTPSFYNNEEAFSKFLGNASYYVAMQNAIVKLIKLTKAKNILELGSAIGSTSIKIAKDNKIAKIRGIDVRENVVKKANLSVMEEKLDNVVFAVEDILNIQKLYAGEDFTFLLFAFHHIPDPLENKIKFLKDYFNVANNSSYLCITETFIQDEKQTKENKEKILNLFTDRRREGVASTFWNVLDGIDDESIQRAHDIARYCGDHEYFAGELVANRDNEYLVTKEWLRETVKSIGYKVILETDIDGIGDGLFLLKVSK